MSLLRNALVLALVQAGILAPAAAQWASAAPIDDYWNALAPDERQLVDAVAADLFAAEAGRRGVDGFDALDADARARFRLQALEEMGVDLDARFEAPRPAARDI